VGSALGQWVFGLLGIGAYGWVGGLIVAVLGAMLLIVILRALKVLK
jgi:uncharacterized membrane protein YeaQ/YmgE (transglycosylase-associated protein family)